MNTRREIVLHYAGLAMQGMMANSTFVQGLRDEILMKHPDGKVSRNMFIGIVTTRAWLHAEAMADEYMKRYPDGLRESEEG